MKSLESRIVLLLRSHGYIYADRQLVKRCPIYGTSVLPYKFRGAFDAAEHVQSSSPEFGAEFRAMVSRNCK